MNSQMNKIELVEAGNKETETLPKMLLTLTTEGEAR